MPHTVEIRHSETNELLYGVTILNAKHEADAIEQAMCHISMTVAATGDTSPLEKTGDKGVWISKNSDTLTDAQVSWQYGRSHGLVSL